MASHLQLIFKVSEKLYRPIPRPLKHPVHTWPLYTAITMRDKETSVNTHVWNSRRGDMDRGLVWAASSLTCLSLSGGGRWWCVVLPAAAGVAWEGRGGNAGDRGER